MKIPNEKIKKSFDFCISSGCSIYFSIYMKEGLFCERLMS